jgi:AP-4 complex subunit epsilon-1
LAEEDYALLDVIASELTAPQPAALQAHNGAHEMTTWQELAGGKVRLMLVRGNGAVSLGINNTSASEPLLKLSLSIDGPEALQKEVTTYPATLRAVPAKATVWTLATFKFPTQLKAFPEFKFKANVSFDGQAFALDLPMNLSAFIVPEATTTPAFGALWKQGGSESLYSLPAGATLDETVSELVSAVHVKSVQRIGQEEILFGSLFTTPFKVQLHAKIHPADKHVDIKVLTKAAPLTQAVVALLKTVFGA